MSIVDVARDKTYTRNLMFFGLNSTEMEVVKLFLDAQEQEIARLQDQLATARTIIESHWSEHAKARPCRCRICNFLSAAIPTSEHERLLEQLATAKEALTKIADARRMGSYVHASNVQTKFVYAQRWAAAALKNLTAPTGDRERKP